MQCCASCDRTRLKQQQQAPHGGAVSCFAQAHSCCCASRYLHPLWAPAASSRCLAQVRSTIDGKLAPTDMLNCSLPFIGLLQCPSLLGFEWPPPGRAQIIIMHLSQQGTT